jgi:hypothetical protein
MPESVCGPEINGSDQAAMNKVSQHTLQAYWQVPQAQAKTQTCQKAYNLPTLFAAFAALGLPNAQNKLVLRILPVSIQILTDDQT